MRQASTGDAEAQFELGAWYIGRCGGYGSSGAFVWYQRAAEGGHAKAQLQLGYSYQHGRGVKKDMDQAVDWYIKSAEQGDVVAARTLGDIYYWGKYVPQDLVTAEKWYKLAVENGDEFSQRRLSKVIKEKDPAAWALKERKRLEAEKDRNLSEQRPKAKEMAKRAKPRFGSITLSVRELPETKALRKISGDEALKNIEDGYAFGAGNVVGTTLDAAADIGTMGGMIWTGSLGVGAVIGLLAGVGMEIDKAKERKLTPGEEAAVLRMSKWLSEEQIEDRLQTQLFALSDQQQAGDLFVLDTAEDGYWLNISVQEIGLFRTPENPRNGRMWVAVQASLVNTESKTEPIQKRICYGSHSRHLASWGQENGQDFRKGLDAAYRYVSNQMLTEMVSLAPDPNPVLVWHKTSLACVESRNENKTYKPGKN